MRLIRPIKPEEIPALVAAAAEDNHVVISPTHLVLDGERQAVGYVSVALPWVSVWMHSQKNTARDSVEGLKALEAILRGNGIKDYLMPCAPDSPYFQHMGKLGFNRMGENVIFRKELD